MSVRAGESVSRQCLVSAQCQYHFQHLLRRGVRIDEEERLPIFNWLSAFHKNL